jgi:ferredoxin
MANPEQSDRIELDRLADDVQSPASNGQVNGQVTGAASLRVRVDQDKCTGDGLCVQYAPQVFEFDVDGLAYVKNGSGELLTTPGALVDVPESLLVAVIDSADECPGDCIHVTDSAGARVAGPDS